MSHPSPSPVPSPDEAALATALADYHHRQALGESVWHGSYRDRLGPLYAEFADLVAIERSLDRGMESQRTPALPRVFGRYTFRALLGHGGMGTVFRADDRKLGREVAVKVLHGGFAHADAALRKRFDDEARLCGLVRHDHVVSIHDADEHEGELYYVMDLVPGESLAQALKRGERPDPRALAVGLRDIAGALGAVHAQGIVHRDVKPSNIMVTPEGKYVLTDFGLARRVQDPRRTRTGQLVGTLPYMSPGQVKGSPDASTPATDVYGLGAVLYEALTGELPFGGEDSEAVIARILRERPRPPRDIDPSIPEGLQDIALRALSKRPEDRPRSAAELADELDLWLRGGDPKGPRPLWSQALLWAREHAVALASVLLLGAGLWLVAAQWWGSRPAHVFVVVPHDKDFLTEVEVLVDGVPVGKARQAPLELELRRGRHTFVGRAAGWAGGTHIYDMQPGANHVQIWVGEPDAATRAKLAQRDGIQPLDGSSVVRSSQPLEAPLWILAPRGDVRRQDLAEGWWIDLAETTERGYLALRRGRELLWSRAVARPAGTDAHVLRGDFPADVLARLRTGDELTLAWSPAEPGSVAPQVTASARLVAAPEADLAQQRLARMLDPALEPTGEARVSALVTQGLVSGALSLAVEHAQRFPDSVAAWDLLRAVAARQDPEALLLDDIDYRVLDLRALREGRVARVRPAPVLPARAGYRSSSR